jgi:hypothetical protein
MVVDLSCAMGCSSNELRYALDLLAEHVMMVLVALHALVEQRSFHNADTIGRQLNERDSLGQALLQVSQLNHKVIRQRLLAAQYV